MKNDELSKMSMIIIFAIYTVGVFWFYTVGYISLLLFIAGAGLGVTYLLIALFGSSNENN